MDTKLRKIQILSEYIVSEQTYEMIDANYWYLEMLAKNPILTIESLKVLYVGWTNFFLNFFGFVEEIIFFTFCIIW